MTLNSLNIIVEQITKGVIAASECNHSLLVWTTLGVYTGKQTGKRALSVCASVVVSFFVT